MLLEEFDQNTFPYFRNQKLLVLPLEGGDYFEFYDINNSREVHVKSANGLGIHCMVLNIEHSRHRVRVRFFGDMERIFTLGDRNITLTEIGGVENIAALSSKEFYNKYGRPKLDLENGVVGWLTFNNKFIALESSEYAKYMDGVTSSDALNWEDPEFGIALDAYTSSDGREDAEKAIEGRLGGDPKKHLNKFQRILPNYGGRRKADRGRLHTDYEMGKTKKRKASPKKTNTKIERAVAIYKSTKKLTREEVVVKLQKALGVTYSNANSYYSKAKGIVERGGTRDAWERSGY